MRCQLGLLSCLSQEFQAAVDGAERCFTWLRFVLGMPQWESPLATQSGLIRADELCVFCPLIA